MHDTTRRYLRTYRFTELLVSWNHKRRYTFARNAERSKFHDPCEIGHLIAFRILVPGTGVSGIRLEGIYTIEMAQVLSKRILVEKQLVSDSQPRKVRSLIYVCYLASQNSHLQLA